MTREQANTRDSGFSISVGKSDHTLRIINHKHHKTTFTMDQASTIEVLSAMKKQEESGYTTVKGQYDATPVDVQCRSLMVDWCFKIADFCKFSPDTVAIAVHNMDRYVAERQQVLHDRRRFQLVAMTCLYTAVKVNEPEAIDPKCVSNLSKGIYSIQEIEEAESEIIATLKWRINPPTAMAFADNYLKLLPTYPNQVEEVVRAQVHLAIVDSSFLGATNSTIAMEAVSNALLLVEPSLFSDHVHIIRESLDLAGGSPDLQAMLMSTAQAVSGVEVNPTLVRRRSSKVMSSAAAHASPRCVAMTQL